MRCILVVPCSGIRLPVYQGLSSGVKLAFACLSSKATMFDSKHISNCHSCHEAVLTALLCGFVVAMRKDKETINRPTLRNPNPKSLKPKSWIRKKVVQKET